MNCNKTIEKEEITEELFELEITKAVKCISDTLQITSEDFEKIIDEVVFIKNIDGKMNVQCHRKIFVFKKNNNKEGVLECCRSIKNEFIKIYHSPR